MSYDNCNSIIYVFYKLLKRNASGMMNCVFLWNCSFVYIWLFCY